MEKRLGRLEVQEGSIAHVGMERAQEKDISATWNQGDFTKNLKLLPTSPETWAGRGTPRHSMALNCVSVR